MAKKANLKAVLTLNNTQFARSIRHAIQMAKDLGKQFARQPIRTSFLAGFLAARKAIQLTGRGVEKFTSGIRAAFGVLNSGGLVAKAIVASAFGFIAHKVLEAAGALEDYTTVFGVLLGSMEKGAERMRILVGFANAKGLRLTSVAAASRVLETLTRGALSTGKGLKFVGDIAFGANVKFEDMAITIGRLYDKIRSGRAAGEELSRLQDVGAITGLGRRKIEAFSAANQGSEAWKVAVQELSRFNGMMDRSSGNWSRIMERFRDSIEEAMRQFGTPVMNSLKPMMTSVTSLIFMASHSLKGIGEKFGAGIKTGTEVLFGIFGNPMLLVNPLILSLKAGFLGIISLFISGMKAGLAVLANKSFYQGLGMILIGLANSFGAALMEAFAGPVKFLLKIVDQLAGKPGGKQMSRDDRERHDRLSAQHQDMVFRVMREQDPEKKAKLAILAQRSADNLANFNKTPDTFGDQAGKMKSDSKGLISGGFDKMFEAMGKAVSGSQVDDIGQNSAWQKAMKAMRDLADEGKKTMKAIKPPSFSPSKAPPFFMGSPFVYSHMNGGLRSGALTTGQLQTGFLAGQSSYGLGVRQTPLIRFRERRQIDMERRAGIQAQLGGRANGDQMIRRGDRKRMQDIQRERLRDKAGIEKTNEILAAIQTKFDQLVSGK